MVFGLSEMRALRRMTISKDGSLTYNTAPATAPVEGRLLEQGFIPILQASVNGVRSNFLIDCGADVTLMNSTFRERTPAAFSGLAESSMHFSGVGGSGHAGRFVLPQLTLRLEQGAVTMHDVTAFAEPSEMNFAGLVGDIGRDFWRGRDFTMDFETHKVSVD